MNFLYRVLWRIYRYTVNIYRYLIGYESIRVSQLWIYPVKSCAGISLDSTGFSSCGLAWDRQWVIVDSEGKFMTQRKFPRMALIKPRLEPSVDEPIDLVLSAPEMEDIRINVNGTSDRSKEIKIWDDVVEGYDQGDKVSDWLSTFLGVPGIRMFRKNPDFRRLVSTEYMEGDLPIEYSPIQTGFADGFPILVLTQESINDLNKRLKSNKVDLQVSAKNFRANIVIEGFRRPYMEDLWKSIKLGGLTLYHAKPCTRCTLPNVNPETGEMRQDNQPLKMLMSYRRVDDRFKYNAVLGANVVHDSCEKTIKVGEVVSYHI